MSNDPVVGSDILRLITAGMYQNPMVLYREYIQNAADSVAARDDGSGSIHIGIDPFKAEVTITDDGTGLSPPDAVRRLVPIGTSTKNPAIDRGFRGVGRLASLAFAEDVHFTTRTCASEPVTRVSWTSRPLRDPNSKFVDVASAIQACATTHTLPGDRWPDRFFQVTVEGVTRHAASTLLNQDAVRRYIGEVCPVPMSPCFPFAPDIRELLSRHQEYFVLDVHLDGDEKPIQRPFLEAIHLTDSYTATFEQLEARTIPRLDGDDPAAVVWLAHTPYTGSIPRRLGVRGLRARAGNIQIGSDDVFSHLFHETRFNGWCVGEVHITDRRIVPNGRRDYFEPGPHLRNLENHIGGIAQEISSRCRGASSYRNRLRNVGVAINRVKCTLDLVNSGYLLEEDAIELLVRTREQLPHLRQTLDELEIPLSQFSHNELSFFEDNVETSARKGFPTLSCVSPDTVTALQFAFAAVANSMPPDSALNLIETILRRVSDQMRPQITPDAPDTQFQHPIGPSEGYLMPSS